MVPEIHYTLRFFILCPILQVQPRQQEQDGQPTRLRTQAPLAVLFKNSDTFQQKNAIWLHRLWGQTSFFFNGKDKGKVTSQMQKATLKTQLKIVLQAPISVCSEKSTLLKAIKFYSTHVNFGGMAEVSDPHQAIPLKDCLAAWHFDNCGLITLLAFNFFVDLDELTLPPLFQPIFQLQGGRNQSNISKQPLHLPPIFAKLTFQIYCRQFGGWNAGLGRNIFSNFLAHTIFQYFFQLHGGGTQSNSSNKPFHLPSNFAKHTIQIYLKPIGEWNADLGRKFFSKFLASYCRMQQQQQQLQDSVLGTLICFTHAHTPCLVCRARSSIMELGDMSVVLPGASACSQIHFAFWVFDSVPCPHWSVVGSMPCTHWSVMDSVPNSHWSVLDSVPCTPNYSLKCSSIMWFGPLNDSLKCSSMLWFGPLKLAHLMTHSTAHQNCGLAH